MEKNTTTLVLVCNRDFCGIVDSVLHREGLNAFQHGNLSWIGGATVEEVRLGGATDVFVVPTDTERAARLISLLRACPIQGETRESSELYPVGEDWSDAT